MNIDIWIEELKKESARLKNIFVTENDFKEFIQKMTRKRNSPLTKFKFELKNTRPAIILNSKKKLEHSQHTEIFRLSNDLNTLCVMNMIFKKNCIMIPEIISILKLLIKNYWKPQMRTFPMGMLDIKRSVKVTQIINKMLCAANQKNQQIIILYCDLDQFKSINIKFGINKGDILLKQIGDIMENKFSQNCILLHNGGDEFIFLLNKKDHPSMITLKNKINNNISKITIGKRELSVSIGTASSKKLEPFEILKENAYFSMLKSKQK